MRFAIYSVEGDSLSWAKRLADEGNEVLFYNPSTSYKDVGEGIIPTTRNYEELVSWGRGGVFVFDHTDAGKRADVLRRMGQRVVGGGSFCDELEGDRQHGIEVARQIGMPVPKTWSFSTISESLAWLRKQDGGFYFKPDKDIGTDATCGDKDVEGVIRKIEEIRRNHGDSIVNILQERIPGVDLSTARWWNGHDWAGPFEATIEHKALLAGEMGLSTGCSFNALWFYEEPEIAETLGWEQLGAYFRHQEAPPGIYDVNCRVSEEDGLPYFLEFTPRFGCDSEPTSQKGIKDLGKLLSTVAEGGKLDDDLFIRRAIFASVRLYIPPYPFDDVALIPDKKSCIGTPIWGADGLWEKHFIGYSLKYDQKQGLCMSNKSGLVGLASGTGRSIKMAFKDVYDYLDSDELEVTNLGYRPDAAQIIGKDFDALVSLGYDIHTS